MRKTSFLHKIIPGFAVVVWYGSLPLTDFIECKGDVIHLLQVDLDRLDMFTQGWHLWLHRVTKSCLDKVRLWWDITELRLFKTEEKNSRHELRVSLEELSGKSC